MLIDVQLQACDIHQEHLVPSPIPSLTSEFFTRRIPSTYESLGTYSSFSIQIQMVSASKLLGGRPGSWQCIETCALGGSEGSSTGPFR